MCGKGYNKINLFSERDCLIFQQFYFIFQECSKEKKKKYKELKKRIEREKELHIISQKMQVKKHLLVSFDGN